MSFNFGAQPFKYAPGNGFSAVSKAPANRTTNSEATAGGASNSEGAFRKQNAPQAIIIEVGFKTVIPAENSSVIYRTNEFNF